MPDKTHMKLRTALPLLGLAFLSFIPIAKADIPPVCDMFADRVTCAKADLGNACATGGTCYEVTCGAGLAGATQTLYKCEVCPPLIDGGACSTTYGAPCGDDAGMCRKAPAWCKEGPLGIACFGPTPELAPAPHDEAGADAQMEDAATNGGPDASATGSVAASSGCGCRVAAMASSAIWRAALPSFMLSAGALALFLDRRRRKTSKER